MIAYKAENNKKAILKLKKDLMQKNNYNSRKFNKRGTYSTNTSKSSNSINISAKISDSKSTSKLVAKEIVKHISGEKGKNLEINICKTLKKEYYWKPSKFKMNFCYRKIIIDNDYEIITANKEIEIAHNNKILYAKLNEDLTCEIRKKNAKPSLIIYNDGKDYKINKSIIIQRSQEIEMDGIYKIKNAKFPNFNNADICILYNSLEN